MTGHNNDFAKRLPLLYLGYSLELCHVTFRENILGVPNVFSDEEKIREGFDRF